MYAIAQFRVRIGVQHDFFTNRSMLFFLLTFVFLSATGCFPVHHTRVHPQCLLKDPNQLSGQGARHLAKGWDPTRGDLAQFHPLLEQTGSEQIN